jgi:hypothetical protein
MYFEVLTISMAKFPLAIYKERVVFDAQGHFVTITHAIMWPRVLAPHTYLEKWCQIEEKFTLCVVVSKLYGCDMNHF